MPGLKEIPDGLRSPGRPQGRTETLIEEAIQGLMQDWLKNGIVVVEQGHRPVFKEPGDAIADVRVAMRALLMRASELGGGQSRL